ncbi:UNVERIFIED_CONTAM: hypothetical protein HDU68_006547 [Siphonaria sp. JEL0065]|nr:hypothetical protein HDU68_006547 [Siphonaria sp. JEL0065]
MSLKFFVHATSFSIDAFSEHALRSAVAFDKALQVLDQDATVAIVAYYSWVLITVETMKLPPAKINHKQILLIDHCSQMAKKTHALDLMARVCVLARQISKSLIEANSQSAFLAAAFVSYIEVESFLNSIYSLGSDLGNEVALVNRRIEQLQELLRCTDSVDVETFTELTRVYGRLLDCFKRAMAKLDQGRNGSVSVNECEENETGGGGSIVVGILSNALFCFDWWVMQAVSTKPLFELTKKLVPNVVQLYLALFKSNQWELQHANYASFGELCKAVRICRDLSYQEGMIWISTTCYNIGSGGFKRGDFEFALNWIHASCTQLQMIGPASQDDMNQMLVKSKGSIKVAVASDSSFRKSLDKALKVLRSIGGIHLNSLMGSDTDLINTLSLLEYELQFLLELVASEPKDVKRLEEAQEVLDLILELTTSGRNPVRRGRCLVQKANILRLLNPTNLDAPISLCNESVEMLKNRADWLGDVDVATYAVAELANAYTTMGICLNESGNYQAKPFQLALQAWKKVLEGVPPYPNKAVYSLSVVGHLYLLLGYSGKAGQSLIQAQVLIESENVTDNDVLSMWMLFYAYYLCSIGNVEKGLATFEKVVVSSRGSIENSISSSFAQFVNSNLLFFMGNLADSVNEGMKSVSKLNRLWTGKDTLSHASRLQVAQIDAPVLESVTTLLRQGDLVLKEEDLDGALELFRMANKQLDEAMTPSSLSLLDDNPSSIAIVSEAPGERKPSHTSPRKSQKDVLEQNVHLKCYGLSFLKTEVTSRIGCVLNLQGKLEDADKLLSTLENSPQRGLEEAEYLNALSNIKFKKVYQGLNGNPLLEMFADSAFSVPWSIPSKATSAGKTNRNSKGPTALEKSISQLEDLLIQSFQCAKLYGATQIIFDTCHRLALLNIIRAYLTGGLTEPTTKELSLATAFYLDQSKGCTHKRELLGSLCEKSTNSKQFERYKQETTWTVADFSREIVDRIPHNWITVSLSADPLLDDLYLTRITRGSTPVTVRLPMKRQAIREGEDDGFGLDLLLNELSDIISTNNETAKAAAGIVAQKREQTREEKIEWWKKRRELDERLKVLLCHVEKYWLGGFKGLLIRDDFRNPLFAKPFSEFKMSAESIISNAIAAKAKTKPVALDPDLCCMILKLGKDPDPFDVEDVLYYLMDAFQYAGCPIGYDEINIDSMETALREAISKFHRAHSILEGKRVDDNPFVEESSSSNKRPHLVLVLDKNLQAIPWENVPCLRGISVSRIPSLVALRDLLYDNETYTVPSIDQNDAFYVLNPSKDLVNTEKEFSGFLKGNPNWKGIINRSPTEKEFEENLQSKAMVLYFGHGGAEQYVRGNRVRGFDKCAVTFLMGCSSGKLTAPGEFDVSGTALNYLMGGSRSIVANLWDVTDRDIDRFSRNMFCEIGLTSDDMFPVQTRSSKKSVVKQKSILDEDEEEDPNARKFYRDSVVDVSKVEGVLTLTEAVAKSRESCELGYLIGAAPVVYGVPVNFG